MFELSYELLHLAVGLVYMFFGFIGGFYALKTLVSLYKSPEMLKTQRKIWLPLLIGAAFFTTGGILHLAEHSFYPNPVIDLLYDIFIATGFLFYVAGILQYSMLQIEYYKLKQEALKRTQHEQTKK